jgi:hypothetical protein
MGEEPMAFAVSITDLNEGLPTNIPTTFENLNQYIKINFVEVSGDGNTNMDAQEITSGKLCSSADDFASSTYINQYFQSNRPLSVCPESYGSLSVNGIVSNPSSKRAGIMISWCDKEND